MQWRSMGVKCIFRQRCAADLGVAENMKRFLLITALALIGSAVFIGQANADQYTLTSVGNNVFQGEYIGPYTATASNGSTLQIICDDFNTTVYQGQSWTATLVNFSDPNFLSKVKFGGIPNAMKDYMAAAYLAQQIMANLSNKTLVDELAFALWGIFSSTAYNQMDSTAKFYYQQAFLKSPGGNYSNVAFLVPNGRTPFQEYITILPTPEPSTLMLIGAGVVLIALLSFKKLRA
jgi:hypothetical protein